MDSHSQSGSLVREETLEFAQPRWFGAPVFEPLPPFGVAIAQEDWQGIERFLEQDEVEGSEADSSSYPSPLQIACSVGNADIVERLLDAGASFEGNDRFDHPIMYAARQGHKDVVQLLVERGADVNHRTIDGPSALVDVVHDFEMVKLLLDLGANVNETYYQGRTALQVLCMNLIQDPTSIEASKEIVDLLVERGADLNDYSNESERTPLCEAVEDCSKEVVQLLLKYDGIRVEAFGRDGDLPLQVAVRKIQELASEESM